MRDRMIPLSEAVKQVRRCDIEKVYRDYNVPKVINRGARGAHCPYCNIRIWHYTRYCPNCRGMICW